MKNQSFILEAYKTNFVEHLELTRVMFVTGLIRTGRTSDTKISPMKKLHKLRRVQLKRTRKKEETCEKFKLSEVKQNLDSIISLYYLMLREMKQDVPKEQYKREHKPKYVHFLSTVSIILSM
jgi:hypothetical protein